MVKIYGLLAMLMLIFFYCQPEREKNNNEAKKNLTKNTDIIFQGSGAEPNWEVKINVNGGIHFISDTEIKNAVTLNSKIIPIMDVAANSFQGETDSTNIRVEIFKNKCIDSQSGDTLTYKTKVMVKKSSDEKYYEFEGCGKHYPDYRLNDIWILVGLNGSKIDEALFKKKRPYIEINLEERKVFGFAGCNNFNGSIAFEGLDIIFNKDMAVTMMSCPNLEFESNFIKSLTRSSLTHSIVNNELILERGDVKLEFRKSD